MTSIERRQANKDALLAAQKTAKIGQATRRTDILKARPGASVDALETELQATIAAINGQDSFAGLKALKVQSLVQAPVAPVMTPAVAVQP
jgi:hypothetical protein